MQPFFDPLKTYEQNYLEGPFGAFTDGKIYKNPNSPQRTFMGIPVYLPFGIPAGPLINGDFIQAAFDKGFDLCVYKTVRTKKYPSNPWPNVLSVHVKGNLTPNIAGTGLLADNNFGEENLSITNSFGVPSFDPDIWQKDMENNQKNIRTGQVLIGSFQGTINPENNHRKYIDDFVLAAKLVSETGVKVIEANLSCPNEGTANLLCFDIPTVKEILYRIKNELSSLPLVIKISYFHKQDLLENLIKEVGRLVEGISTINTIPAKIYDIEGKPALPGPNRLVSGICGRSIKWAGLEMTERLQKLRQANGFKFAIIGVGGVTIPDDYEDYISRGADAVMSATGAMWNPYLAQEIKESEKGEA